MDELTEEQKKNRKLGEEEMAVRLKLGEVPKDVKCLYNQEVNCRNRHLWVPRFGKVTRDPETKELINKVRADPFPPDKEQCDLCLRAGGPLDK